MSPDVTSVPVTTIRHMPLGLWWGGIQPALNTLAGEGEQGGTAAWENILHTKM